MDWFKFHKVVHFFYHLKWLMDLIWTCLIFLEHYIFRDILTLWINKDKICGKGNFAFWLLWDYMANGHGEDTKAVRIGRFLSSVDIGKISKSAEWANQKVEAKVVYSQMTVSFGFQKLKKQVCPGYYFWEDKTQRSKWNNWNVHRRTALRMWRSCVEKLINLQEWGLTVLPAN